MSHWTTTAAAVVTALGLVVGGVVLMVTRDARTGLRCALELWLGAGLIRLGGSRTWEVAATAAIVLVIRQVVGRELRRQGRDPVSPPGSPSASSSAGASTTCC